MAAVDDWGKVAAIVAIVTIPVFASPLLLQPLFAYARRYAHRLLSRRLRCDSIPFDTVGDHQPPFRQPRLSFPWFPPSVPRTTSRVPRGATFSTNDRIISFCNRAWAINPHQVERPAYLSLNRRYLRMDADSLTAALMLLGFDAAPAWGHHLATGWPAALPDESGRQRFGDRPYILQHGTVEGYFHRRIVPDTDDAYLLGKLYGFPPASGMPADAEGPTKSELLAIARGYPPFYRQTFQSYSGVRVDHPTHETRDAIRAGWVVAIGFSSHAPTRLYNARYADTYDKACGRVHDVLRNVLCTTFGSDPALGPAVEATASSVGLMNHEQTGSVLSQATQRIVFGGTAMNEVGHNLDAAQVRRILDLFNDTSRSRDALSEVERDEFRGILLEALRAALVGVYEWWQYKNNKGDHIPEWLLDGELRRCPIWVEDEQRTL